MSFDRREILRGSLIAAGVAFAGPVAAQAYEFQASPATDLLSQIFDKLAFKNG
jgi:hypothetical protein